MLNSNDPGVPRALANDNWYGYVNKVIVEWEVRWIEMAVVLPFWTTLIVYYLEGDRGHLMTEQLGAPRYRWGVRGNCFSYHMPWEDLTRCLGRCTDDDELELPLSPDLLVHVVRLHMKVGTSDWCKHLKQVRLRAHVALRLAYTLIENKHPVYQNRGSAVALKARFARLLEERYPDPESDALPEAERDGRVPDAIMKAAEESLQGKNVKGTTAKRKNATPDLAPTDISEAFDYVRPQAILAERSSGNIADGNDARVNALGSFDNLEVQTGSRLIYQWNARQLRYRKGSNKNSICSRQATIIIVTALPRVACHYFFRRSTSAKTGGIVEGTMAITSLWWSSRPYCRAVMKNHQLTFKRISLSTFETAAHPMHNTLFGCSCVAHFFAPLCDAAFLAV